MNKLHPSEIACVILCGGRSSRMGEDKALLPFSSHLSLSEYQFNRLKLHFKEVYISSNENKFNFLNEEELILDENKDIHSPIVALNTIFEKLPNQKIFIITVDTPLVSIESIEKIVNESVDFDICVAQTERVHNLCGVFNSSISLTTKKMIIEDFHKVGYLLKNNNTKIVQFDNDDEFLNLNNKIEYEKALGIIN
mgnify:CR=1 FL=1